MTCAAVVAAYALCHTASERKYPGLNWTCPRQNHWEMACCSVSLLSMLEHIVFSLCISSYILGYILVATGTLITLVSKQRIIANLDAVIHDMSPVEYYCNFKVLKVLKFWMNVFSKLFIFLSGLRMVVSTHFFSFFFLNASSVGNFWSMTVKIT